MPCKVDYYIFLMFSVPKQDLSHCFLSLDTWIETMARWWCFFFSYDTFRVADNPMQREVLKRDPKETF